MTSTAATAVLCIAVAGVGAQWLAWRLRLPAIVLLFAVGLLVGPGLHILQPAATFGGALRPLVGLAVAIVVFEGGLALDFRELRAAGEGVLRLTTFALPISFCFATLAARLLGSLSWGTAALYGAITVVTGPTVVLPLLRHTRLERRAASFLKWEAIVNDPIGALMAAIVLALLIAGGRPHGSLVFELLAGLVAAVALGLGAALLVRWLVRHDQMPEVLKTPVLLALALGVYALANLVMDEAGLAAATIFGIALANLAIPGIGELARFKESLVVLIVSALFVVLTASLDRAVFADLSSPVVLLTAAMLFLVRPAAIMLATLGSGLTWQERILSGWIAPRGIVAAAVAGVASTKLSNAGIVGGESVMPAVFALIAATMVLHGFTLAPLARRLGLTLGDRPGLAIVGATPWTVDLAKTLSDAGTPVLMIDTYPGALDRPRELNLPTLQAEVLSAHGEDSLSGCRVDYLLAATANDVYNSLACARLAPDLGRGRVFQLAPTGGDIDAWVGLDREWRGMVIGTPPIDFVDIRQRHKQGWRFTIRPPSPPEAESPGPSEVGAPEAESPQNRSESLDILFAVLRRNGDIAFASAEGAALAVGAEDRRIVLASGSPSSGRTTPTADQEVAPRISINKSERPVTS